MFDDMVRTQAGAWAKPFLVTVVLDLWNAEAKKSERFLTSYSY